MCLVSASRREVPQAVFDSLRSAVNNLIRTDDVLSTTSIVHLQSLLILCMMGDCHSQYVSKALTALWLRLGTAIRMAQDLGLHRVESIKENIELRRRLWGACVISDRWTSLAYGHPHMIDIQDCDARLPSSGEPNDLYMDELVRLSVILGRVLKTIYSPSGLILATDEVLETLLADIETWKNNLPADLQFQGSGTPRNAGLLHLLYSCVCMIFWRVFMRISYTCPEHLKFTMTMDNWMGLVKLTGEAIDWLDANEHIYDVWLLVAYAATSCALVQYHTWARRVDPDIGAEKLRKLRDCVRRWEGSYSPEHMSARRKTAEIISLLYEATQGPRTVEVPALNPTGGVKANPPAALEYKKDPTRPGGGVFVAHGSTRAEDFEGLGVPVINSSSDEDGEGEPSDLAAAVPSVPSANDRTLLLSSSPFAPPLPTNESPMSAFRHGMTSSSLSPPHGADGQPQGSSSGAPPSASMVNITPLGGRRAGNSNVNPAMNNMRKSGPGIVQVMNVLDVPHTSTLLEQYALADTGLLEGIPGGMFDWNQWDTFFTRFQTGSAEGGAGVGGSSPFPQAQKQKA